MNDISPPAVPPDANLNEPKNRRTPWSHGSSLRLADGASWRLPVIDCNLLVLNPHLLDDVARTFDLAAEVHSHEDDLRGHTLATAVYHCQLAQLAVSLLQRNYDLTDDQWRRLLAFDDLAAMLRMTIAVAEVVAESIHVWMPFHQTRGARGAVHLTLN